ncbi:unnamed protein product [Calypogeia fissa]
MSSLRNAVKRRTHKERSQPSDRNRLGLLEKHKDYVLRAKDFHKKEKRIQVLREKAAFKNPDEFYYKMINSKLVDGVHRPKAGKEYSQEEVLLMKTQDIRYVLNKAQSEQKKVERLKAVLHSVGQAPTNSHVYFAEDRLEAEKIATLAVDTEPILKKVPKRIQKKQSAAYRELQERTERAEKMKNMVVTMTLKKQIMGKGRKRKLPGEVPGDDVETVQEPVFKWRQERKR